MGEAPLARAQAGFCHACHDAWNTSKEETTFFQPLLLRFGGGDICFVFLNKSPTLRRRVSPGTTQSYSQQCQSLLDTRIVSRITGRNSSPLAADTVCPDSSLVYRSGHAGRSADPEKQTFSLLATRHRTDFVY